MPANSIDDLGALTDQHISGLKMTAEACFASLLTATKRMVGRWAASHIASASAASVFWRLTKGLTAR
jgi:hypothetical protein